MKQRLLSYIACTQCGTGFDVEVEHEVNGEILEGSLRCRGCQSSFPVIRGIPRFLPAELSAAKQATAEAFGYEWTHYTELTDADREEFLDWIKPLDESTFANRVVLDGGCGKGRHLFLSAKFGASEAIGIDLSDAVESAFKNTRHLPNVHVIQADIYYLPFLSSFDFAYSIGVLHHLPDPKAGFLSLVTKLKPGGRIATWVYGSEGNRWIELFVDPVRIHVTSKLPKFITHVLSFLLAIPLYLALKLVYLPASRLPWLASIKRRLPYSDYLCAISVYSFAENFWNVFDHLVAPTAFYHRREEIEDWFATAKLAQVEITARNSNSWRGTGVKELKD
ncbi:MAG: methyltransferase domain-containing protein [Terriglobales bacterium]